MQIIKQVPVTVGVLKSCFGFYFSVIVLTLHCTLQQTSLLCAAILGVWVVLSALRTVTITV